MENGFLVAQKNVRLVVFSALLTALTDIMGKDGKNSVLRFAGLSEYLDKDVPPSTEEELEYGKLQSLLKSMNELLGHGTNAILFESGRKLAVYLSPFGYSLAEVIKKLEKWLGGKWTIENISDGVEKVTIQDCPVCRGLSNAETAFCTIISGTLSRIKEESTGETYEVEEVKCSAMGHENCEYIVKKADESAD